MQTRAHMYARTRTHARTLSPAGILVYSFVAPFTFAPDLPTGAWSVPLTLVGLVSNLLTLDYGTAPRMNIAPYGNLMGYPESTLRAP